MLSLFLGLVRIAVSVLVFRGSSAIFSKLPIRLRVITVYLLKKGKAQKTEDRIAPTLLLRPECRQEGTTARESMG